MLIYADSGKNKEVDSPLQEPEETLECESQGVTAPGGFKVKAKLKVEDISFVSGRKVDCSRQNASPRN